MAVILYSLLFGITLLSLIGLSLWLMYGVSPLLLVALSLATLAGTALMAAAFPLAIMANYYIGEIYRTLSDTAAKMRTVEGR